MRNVPGGVWYVDIAESVGVGRSDGDCVESISWREDAAQQRTVVEGSDCSGSSGFGVAGRGNGNCDWAEVIASADDEQQVVGVS